MTRYQTRLEDSMYVIAEGTRISMRRLMRSGFKNYIGRMSNWTGRYALSEKYMPFYPGYLLGRLWLLHKYTGEDEFKDLAMRILEPIIPDLCDRPLTSQASGLDHYYGLCWAADITGDAQLQKAALRALDRMIDQLWSEKAQIFVISRGRTSVNVDATACLFGFPWAVKHDRGLSRISAPPPKPRRTSATSRPRPRPPIGGSPT
ncbi:MAG: hypothetical protein HY261_01640 [Chloroflexi bacterium]|nr:hypothetical protein [Chloroflexota bacterium]